MSTAPAAGRADRLPVDGDGVRGQPRALRLREIDFSRQTKSTQEQLRRIERAHEGLCRTAAQRLGGEPLREARVRLWADLCRTRMALGRAVGLTAGEVVEFAAAVGDPVTIFVNGVPPGSGDLVVGDDGEWAFRVAEVSSASTVRNEHRGAAATRPDNATVEGKEA